jgi:hypothetical protein
MAANVPGTELLGIGMRLRHGLLRPDFAIEVGPRMPVARLEDFEAFLISA